MSLRRSKSALHSIHRFLSVDVVVFCEGGAPVSDADILIGGGTEGTLDILYWDAAKQFVGGPRRAHFKSVGGKPTLLSLAADVIATGVTTVSVCMDGDYDDLRGRSILHPSIAYTYGYSWESDVTRPSVVERVARSLMGPGADADQAIATIRTKIGALSGSLLKPTEIDYALVCRGKPALFDRDRPGALMSINDKRFIICSQKVKQRQQALGYKRKPKRLRKFVQDEVARWAVGKVSLKGVYLIFDSVAHNLQIRLDYPTFARMLIAETLRSLRQGELPDLAGHLNASSLALA